MGVKILTSLSVKRKQRYEFKSFEVKVSWEILKDVDLSWRIKFPLFFLMKDLKVKEGQSIIDSVKGHGPIYFSPIQVSLMMQESG